MKYPKQLDLFGMKVKVDYIKNNHIMIQEGDETKAHTGLCDYEKLKISVCKKGRPEYLIKETST